MRRVRSVLPVLLLVAVAAAACASSDGGGRSSGSTSSSSTSSSAGSSSPTGAELEAALSGRTFISQSVTMGGVDHPLVGGQPITVTFADGELSARPGCNMLGAEFSIDGDRLVWSSGSMTEMACTTPGLMDQDGWFGGLLSSGPTLVLDGDQLTITSGSTVIVFADKAAVDPDRPLLGTTWTLESIIEGDGASSVPVGASATLLLPDESHLTWQGCNRGGAPITSMSPTTFTLGDMTSTQIGCGGPEAEVDGAMNAVLHDTVTYAIDGAVLHLRNFEHALDFRAS